MDARGLMIKLESVTKAFKTPGGRNRLEILRGLDMSIAGGETVALVGPSGCGKSTLLNIIGGLDIADSGLVEVGGQDLAKLTPANLAQFRNRTVGFLFQNHHLLPQCSVLENALIPALAFSSRPDAKTSSRASELLEKVGLKDRLNHRPSELSGGERQRVALVRSVVLQPKVLLADEPTGALDPETAGHMAELLIHMNHDEGLTLVAVTHSMELASRMSRTLQFIDGTLRDISADHNQSGTSPSSSPSA